MKLRKLHIDDYKMFKDFNISFIDDNDKALPIIILAGVNGSGKSTLLEFINHISVHTKEFYSLLNEYDDFYIRDDSGKIIGVEPRELPVEIEEKGIIFNTIDNIGRFAFNPIYFPSKADDISNVEKEFVKYWYNQVKFHNKRNNEITEALQKFITEVLNGLDLDFTYSYIDEDDNIFFQNSNNKKFKISELSTGEQTLLSKVLYLFLKEYKDKVILIDEPELSLHPSWQNRVLKIYENFAIKNNCQIIIATHSPHIIGSAKNKYLRFLIKNKEGKIEAIENITAYGRDIEWVLQQMGVVDIRLPQITKRFDEIQELINNQEFDRAESELDKLEYVIGDNDKDILALRNDLAFERMDFEEDN